MNKFFTNKLSIISFIFIPIIFLWHPNWLGFLGVQPYWPLFWLLPWSMINGSINGLIFGLFLGLILDSLTLDDSFTQIPGLIFCGFLFGRIKFHSDIFAVFVGFNCSSIVWTTPIGMFGGNNVLAGEEDTKSPILISTSFE